MKGFCTFLFVLLPFFLLKAQIPSWSTVKVPNDIYFQQLQKDSIGFLWMLDKNGVYKYDGYEISKMLEPDKNQKSFTALEIDQNSHLLVGCENGELLRVNPFNISIEQLSIPKLKGPVSFIHCPDPINHCLTVSYGNELYWKISNRDTLLSDTNILASNEVYAGISEANELFLATDQGLQIIEWNGDDLDSEIYKKEDGLFDVIITDIIIKDSSIWMADFDRSISKFDRLSGDIEHFIFDQPSKIHDLLFLQNGLLVVSRDDGLYFKVGNKFIKKYPLDYTQRVLCSVEDEESNLWLGVPDEGLVKGSLLFQKLDLNLDQIQALMYDDNERFWIGNSKGLFIYNQSKLQQKVLNNNITSIAKYGKFVWIGTFSDGIYVLNKSTLEIQGHFSQWDEHVNQSILYLLPLENKIFISSLTGVVSFDYNEQNSSAVQLNNPEYYNDIIGPGYVYQIIVSNDYIYFATDRQGVKLIQQEKFIHYKNFNDGKAIGSVYSMAIDTSGNLWFASSESGLGYLKEGKAYKRQSLKNPSDPYTTITNISDGSILLIRSESIDILDPTKNHIMYYDSELGISKEMPYLNTFSSLNGELWFAHDHGLYRYQVPSKFKIHPEVQIDRVLVNLTNANGRHIFDQNENNIQFHYTGSWLTNPEKLSYQYQLVGIDEVWRNTLDRSVSYPKLNPGSYTFKVRSSENTQFDNEPEQHYDFTINRFFYNTLWFWLIISALGILWLNQMIIARRRRQLLKSEMDRKHVESQLLNLKNQLNPHFLFNSFNTLIGLIEEDTERSIIFTEKLTDFYRLVLEHGKNQLVRFEEEFRLIQLYVNVLNERFNDAIEINLISDQINSLIPPLTLQLLVENAIKHNEVRSTKKLVIDIYQASNFICIRNKKYPKTFPVSSSGSGLDNIKKRYLLLNANTVTILDSEHEFEVRLPLIPSTTKTAMNSAI